MARDGFDMHVSPLTLVTCKQYWLKRALGLKDMVFSLRFAICLRGALVYSSTVL